MLTSLSSIGTVIVVIIAIYVWNSQDSDSSENFKPIDDKLKMESKLSALVLGATGEVGKAIVHELVKHSQFEKITLLARRKLDLPSESNYEKVEQKIVDFEKLSEYAEAFQGHQVGFSALGTTRGKAGAKGFYRVDHDYVVESAKMAKEAGVKHFHLVSSGAANKNSHFLYLKTKGEADEEVSAMGFERASIYRPGFLLVDRVESRTGEPVARAIVKTLDFGRWFSIDVPVLAKAIVENCFRPSSSPVEIINQSDILKMAKDKKGWVYDFMTVKTQKGGCP